MSTERRDAERTAYLVAHFDIRQTGKGVLPVFSYVGIYSEAGPTTSAKVMQVCLAQAVGDGYEDATANLREQIKDNHGLAWALEQVPVSPVKAGDIITGTVRR